MSVQVRPVEPGEIDAVRQLLLDNGWQHRVGSTPQLAELISRSHLALVAVAEGKVVGFVRALGDGLTNGYVSMLVVAESHRRRGVGRALMQAVMGDNDQITWVLRAARDESAIAFYERLGFVRSTVAMERTRAP
jgi:ribosomal protein S18 acetylase RimI-like enzyme